MGRLTSFMTCETEMQKQTALKIVNDENSLVIVEMKGHIDEQHINEFIPARA